MTDNGWRPIETAPKDGTWFVTANFNVDYPEFEAGAYDPLPYRQLVEVGENLYRYEDEEHPWPWIGFSNIHRATHWMPLPLPPQE